MKHTSFTCFFTQIILLTSLSVFLLASCGTQAGKQSGQVAAVGGIAGTVGGMVSALVFGGNVADAAARGAVWGASTGAVSGAIAGSQADKRIAAEEQAKREKAAKKMKKELGEDSYQGLVALAQCKHAVARGYAEIAQDHSKEKYALAGYWLEAVTYADQGDMAVVESLYPGLIEVDPAISSVKEAEMELEKGLEGLVSIRKNHGLNGSCK